MSFICQNIYIKILFFQFYFLNPEFKLTILSTTLQLSFLIDDVYLEGTVSLFFFFNFRPGFYSLSKNGKHFAMFCNLEARFPQKRSSWLH